MRSGYSAHRIPKGFACHRFQLWRHPTQFGFRIEDLWGPKVLRLLDRGIDGDLCATTLGRAQIECNVPRVCTILRRQLGIPHSPPPKRFNNNLIAMHLMLEALYLLRRSNCRS